MGRVEKLQICLKISILMKPTVILSPLTPVTTHFGPNPMQRNQQNELLLNQHTAQFNEHILGELAAYYTDKIQAEYDVLAHHYANIMHYDTTLSRSFFTAKNHSNLPQYRWFHFREGFSVHVVRQIIREAQFKKNQSILDPFSGSGTTLFAAAEMGLEAQGIELLPIGKKIFDATYAMFRLSEQNMSQLKEWLEKKLWLEQTNKDNSIIAIDPSYPSDTALQIKNFKALIINLPQHFNTILEFALMCIVESISYSRKDGQFLRWDYRSSRSKSNNFQKQTIKDFSTALISKVNEMIDDVKSSKLTLYPKTSEIKPKLILGSCLDHLPQFYTNQFDGVITSPPYCNRYDYTQTYELELTSLGMTRQTIRDLQQHMLHCSVVNSEKNLLLMNSSWETPIEHTKNSRLLQQILRLLELKQKYLTLNHSKIPHMISGYFREMACVIFELYRVSKRNSRIFMINDNVKYANVTIPVDYILCDLAEAMGFSIERIIVLKNHKGNSSQQMALFGKESLRKCIYIWKKT